MNLASLQDLSLDKIAPQYWLHDARHRIIGNIESSPRFEPFSKRGSRHTDSILESAASELNDQDVLAMHFWLSWILILDEYRQAPEYRDDYLNGLRAISFKQRLQYLSSEFKHEAWPAPAPLTPTPQLPEMGDWALVVTRNYMGLKAAVRDFGTEIVEAMSSHYDKVVVATIGPLGTFESYKNIVGAAIPPGFKRPEKSRLNAVRQAVIAHRDCASVRGIVARRIGRWLARIEFARGVIDERLPTMAPSAIVSMGVPDPECTLILNKYACRNAAVVMPMVEPVPTSRISFPCPQVFVTGTAQANALSAANPKVRCDAVGSNEAFRIVTARRARHRGGTAPSNSILISGKMPEASWHNTAIVAAVVERARRLGFERVIYRGKPDRQGNFTSLPGADSIPLLRDALNSSFLELTDGVPFEDQMAEAGVIFSATGNSFLLGLLCEVPIMGYCFNPRVDLGEAPYLARIPEAERPIICRDIKMIGDCVERTLERAKKPTPPLAPDIVAALFGDITKSPASQIAQLIAAERDLPRALASLRATLNAPPFASLQEIR